MTTYYYSANTGGFYVEEVHGKNMPPDVVAIAEEEWQGLLLAQANGMSIVPDVDGKPIVQARGGE